MLDGLVALRHCLGDDQIFLSLEFVFGEYKKERSFIRYPLFLISSIRNSKVSLKILQFLFCPYLI